MDYMVLGCNGVFDNLSSKEVGENIKSTITNNDIIDEDNIHDICSEAVDNIILSSVNKKVGDNVSCIVILFNNILINKSIYQQTYNTTRIALNESFESIEF